MKCPQCGYCDSKTSRRHKVTGKNKEAFVKKYRKEIKKNGMDRSLLLLARKELEYSVKTIDCDIAASILNEYNRFVTRSPRRVGQH